MLKAVDVNEIGLDVYHSDILFNEQQVPVTNESDDFPGLHIVAFWQKNLHQYQQTDLVATEWRSQPNISAFISLTQIKCCKFYYNIFSQFYNLGILNKISH